MSMLVVLTRPQEDSERTAAALRARGHEPLIAPLLRVEAVPAELRPHWGAIVITSANAASVLTGHPARAALVKLPLYAVGRRSADAARAVGFANVTTAGGDLHDLLRIVSAHRPDDKAPLLYLAGEDRSGDLIGDLAVRGIAAELVVVYRAAAAPFSDALIEALKSGKAGAVVHFSKRSAESYLAGATAAGLSAPALALRHICLSDQIAGPLRTAGARTIAVAKRPDEAALLELLEQSAQA